MRVRALYVMVSTVLLGAAASTVFAQSLDEGIRLYQTYKFPEAVGVLSQVAQSEPENVEAHRYLGLAQLGAGNLDGAESTLERALMLDPKSDSVLVGQARVFIEKKQYDRAEAALREAESINKDNAEVRLYRGANKLAQRDYQGAVDDLNVSISQNANNAYAHYYAGLAWNGLRKPDKMVDSFQTFLKLAPEAPEAARVRSLLRSVR